MSDPVTNAEVEDVLSSIRRLVSEDKRPLRLDDPGATPDRLVLTPSLRVQDPVEEGGEPSTSQDAEATPRQNADFDFQDDTPFEFEHGRAVHDDHGDAAANEGAEPAEAQNDTAQDLQGEQNETEADAEQHAESQNNDAPLMLGDPVTSENAQSEAAQDTDSEGHSDHHHHGETQASDDPQHSEGPEIQHADDNHEQHHENVEAGHEQQDDQDHHNHQPEAQSNASPEDAPDWEADVWEDLGHNSQSDDACAARDQDAIAEEQAANDDLSDFGAQDRGNVLSMSAASAALGASSGLSAKIAALETAIGGISDNFEPETAGEDIYQATGKHEMRWDEAAAEHPAQVDVTPTAANGANRAAAQAFDDATGFEAAPEAGDSIAKGVEETTLDAVVTETGAAAAAALAEQAPTLDEEALRELVSEIVRAELQGALGERITRNVRKLVRREIHRALTAQELE